MDPGPGHFPAGNCKWQRDRQMRTVQLWGCRALVLATHYEQCGHRGHSGHSGPAQQMAPGLDSGRPDVSAWRSPTPNPARCRRARARPPIGWPAGNPRLGAPRHGATRPRSSRASIGADANGETVGADARGTGEQGGERRRAWRGGPTKKVDLFEHRAAGRVASITLTTRSHCLGDQFHRQGLCVNHRAFIGWMRGARQPQPGAAPIGPFGRGGRLRARGPFADRRHVRKSGREFSPSGNADLGAPTTRQDGANKTACANPWRRARAPITGRPVAASAFCPVPMLADLRFGFGNSPQLDIAGFMARRVRRSLVANLRFASCRPPRRRLSILPGAHVGRFEIWFRKQSTT
jgi:hypothetical protein